MSVVEYDPDDAPKIWDEDTVIAITEFEYEKAERGGKYQPPSDAQVTVMQAYISSSELSTFKWLELGEKFINKRLNNDREWHARVWEALADHEGGE